MPDISAITISDWQKEGGFAGFVRYKIRTDTSTGELSCYRRFREFEWLHLALTRAFPSKELPPLPGKRTFGRLREDFIELRRRELQKLLTFIALDSQLSTCRQVFLFCGSEVEMSERAFAQLQDIVAVPKRPRNSLSIAVPVLRGPPLVEPRFSQILRSLRDCPFVSGRQLALKELTQFTLSVAHVGCVLDVLPFSSERIDATRLLAPLLEDTRHSRKICGHLRFEHERAAIRELLDALEESQR